MKKEFQRILGLFMCFVFFAGLIPGFAVTPSAGSKKVSVSIEELDKLVSGCSFYRKSCWTENSFNVFNKAYSNAKTLLSDGPATQHQIDTAYNSLSSARSGLVHNGQITQCPYCTGNSKAIDESDVISLKKIKYSSLSSRNVMDMYIPDGVSGDNALVVYIHGGTWISGSNSIFTTTAYETCQTYGIVTIAINYRFISEDVSAYDILDDISASIAKAKEVASEYGLNLTKLMTYGTSAGAHLAMLYAYSRAEVSPVKPVCVFDECGPTDLTSTTYWSSTISNGTIANCLSYLSNSTITDEASQQACAEALRAVSPLYYVNSNTVPTIVCHGKSDNTVDYSESLNLVKAFEDFGVPHELITFNTRHTLYKDSAMTEYAKTRFDYCANTYLLGNGPDETHNYTSSVTPKTCTTDGYTMNICSDCGKYYVSDIVSASHDQVVEKGYEPTCTEEGLSDRIYCGVCGEIIATHEVIPAKGHTEVSEITVLPTYTSTGVRVTRCSVCSLVLKTENVPKLPLEHKKLNDLVSGCSNYRSSCWTEESWTEFMERYSNAKSVLCDSVDKAELKNTFDLLSCAKSGLVHDGQITECPYCTGSSKAIDESDVIKLQKVRYSSLSDRNTMDIYIPGNVIGDSALIVYVPGNLWTTGTSKTYSTTALSDCMKYGVVTIAINNRYLSEDVNAFDILDDIQASVAKAKEIAARYGINLTKMMTFGNSAGAHLAMLYAYSRADVSPVKPACVYEESGPTDLTSPTYWDSYYGVETISKSFSWLSDAPVTDAASQLEYSDALKAVSPLYYVNSDTVPTIICHGTRDIVFDYSEAQKLAAAFEQAGATCELLAFNAVHSVNKDTSMYAYAKTRYDYYINTYLLGNGPDVTHNYTSSVTPKTCTTDGYTMNICSDCGKYYVSDIVNASHERVVESGYAPTCTETGLTDSAYCSVCGEIFTNHEVIPAKGHTEVSEITVLPTYTSTGIQVTKCSVCGLVFKTETVPELVPEYRAKKGSGLVFDDSKMVIKNIPQGESEICRYLDLGGCTVETTDTVTTTGSLITIRSFSGEILASYTAVVSGDVTGDGYADTFDLAVATEYVNTFTTPVTYAFMSSVDMCEDGYLDASDLAYLIAMVNFEV